MTPREIELDKCIFCGNSPLKVNPDKSETLCTNCQSMYRILDENKERYLIYAYPHKSIRLNYEMQIIYLRKE